MYRFNDDGIFTKHRGDSEHIYEAVVKRLEDLLRLISEDAELEIDYDNVNDTWIAMEYYPEKDYAAELLDDNGSRIVAFKGVPHDTMVNMLNKTDVWFVG